MRIMTGDQGLYDPGFGGDITLNDSLPSYLEEPMLKERKNVNLRTRI